jgi:hypothetical protein
MTHEARVQVTWIAENNECEEERKKATREGCERQLRRPHTNAPAAHSDRARGKGQAKRAATESAGQHVGGQGDNKGKHVGSHGDKNGKGILRADREDPLFGCSRDNCQ